MSKAARNIHLAAFFFGKSMVCLAVRYIGSDSKAGELIIRSQADRGADLDSCSPILTDADSKKRQSPTGQETRTPDRFRWTPPESEPEWFKSMVRQVEKLTGSTTSVTLYEPVARIFHDGKDSG